MPIQRKSQADARGPFRGFAPGTFTGSSRSVGRQPGPARGAGAGRAR
jgi:hypothetical protein